METTTDKAFTALGVLVMLALVFLTPWWPVGWAALFLYAWIHEHFYEPRGINPLSPLPNPFIRALRRRGFPPPPPDPPDTT